MAADEDRDQKSFKERRREIEDRGIALRRITEKIQAMQEELEALNRRQARRQAK